MRGVKEKLNEYRPAVSEAEWQAIHSDPRVLRYRRLRHLARWAVVGGVVTAAAVIIVSTVLLSKSRHSSTVAETATAADPTPVMVQSTPADAVEVAAVPSPTPEVPAPASHADVPEHGVCQPSAVPAPTVAPVVSSSTIVAAVPASSTTAPAGARIQSAPIATPATTQATATPKASPAPSTTIVPNESEPAKTPSPSQPEPTQSYELFIPNSFTPNGDGINDLFKVVASFPTQQFEMSIYSRSGDRLFSTRSIDIGWDGQKYGSIMQDGVYLYLIKYTDPEGNSHTKKGQLFLYK